MVITWRVHAIVTWIAAHVHLRSRVCTRQLRACACVALSSRNKTGPHVYAFSRVTACSRFRSSQEALPYRRELDQFHQWKPRWTDRISKWPRNISRKWLLRYPELDYAARWNPGLQLDDTLIKKILNN